MLASIAWLKELIDLKVPVEEVLRLLPLRTIGTKEVTDRFIELDMKGYNRADLLSMRGVALEIAAITSSSVTFTDPAEKDFIWNQEKLPETKTETEDFNLAPLFCVAKIEGLKVENSPDEWVKRLGECGMRQVNNIADVTNLVMLEYGQPLHSFDASSVKDELIVVRRAKADEEIRTLDNKLRKLLSDDIVLADAEKPLDVAGVMGGKDTAIKESTTTILLTACLFNPTMVRKTSSRLGLHSEASRRFQHGLTRKRLLQAFNAAINMYQDLGGKLTAISIKGDLEDPVKTITLHHEKVNSLIGIEITPEEVENSLKKLGFTLASKVDPLRAWEVTVPYFRLDIEIEADLIEEVARMHGYENIPPKELVGKMPETVDQRLFELIYNLKTALAQTGLTEVETYSFLSTQVLNNLKINKDELIKIANPISSETEYMRDQLWPNLLEKVAENLKYYPEVAIFEIGKVYKPKEQDLPEEKYKLSLVFSDGSDENMSKLWHIFQKTASHIGSGKLELQVKTNKENGTEDLFHPTRFARLLYQGQKVGEIAEVHPRIVNKLGVEKRVSILEIEVEPLTK